MRGSTIVTTISMLAFCWLAGAEIGIAKTSHDKTVREKPYRHIMQLAVEGLNKTGVTVAMPKELPPITICEACLAEHESFGAYLADSNQVIMPEGFDIKTSEGQSTLIHEYGHFLLTKAGIPEAEQESRCVLLGNSVMQKFFMIVLQDK